MGTHAGRRGYDMKLNLFHRTTLGIALLLGLLLLCMATALLGHYREII